MPSELGRLGAEFYPAQGSIPKFRSLSFSDCFLKAVYLGPQQSSPPGGRAGLGWALGTLIVSAPPLLAGRGVSVGPILSNSASDIFCDNENGPNFLFHNQGNGTFVDAAAGAGE